MPRIDIKKESEELHRAVREQTVGYIVAALSVVAGLAWNEAIKALINYFYPFDEAQSIIAKFLYAVIMTIVVIVMTIIVRRALSPKSAKA